MTAFDLQCLSFHATVDPALTPDGDHDLDVMHKVRPVGLDGEEVALTLLLSEERQPVAQFHATYLVTFGEEPPGEQRAWNALSLSWPYLRQEAGSRLAPVVSSGAFSTCGGTPIRLRQHNPGDASYTDIWPRPPSR